MNKGQPMIDGNRWWKGGMALFLGVLFLLGAQACSSSDSTPVLDNPETPDAGSEVSEPEAKAVKVARRPDYRYDATNKQNPFRPFILVDKKLDEKEGPLQRYDIEQLTLRAVVWNIDDPKAMVEDPTGRGHVVKIGTDIGKNKGIITRINDRAVLVRETYVDFSGHETTKDVTMRILTTNLFGEES